ncbi:hypothetical protein [Deinococcus sedimenti]|uniref:Uncharacterized protein n=1 Tax=Deinococcus sedimenti TaxID=1867090 RepID=A0ABQ2S4L7_9DEIO|nr:hypothetical protein [Deinococcus sedimenti]GGR90033.1 hypothetical protein GCM10008960_16400 [Deinococcus sedimenti]
MTDTHYFTALLLALILLYAARLLWTSARRLHYRDRPRYWQKAWVLVLAGFAAAVLATLALTGIISAAALWPALVLAALTGGAAYWIDLNPQRALAVLRSRR